MLILESARPMRAGAPFGHYIASVPSLIENGQLEADGSTSILPQLQALESVCATGGARATLFTEGVEWTAQIDGPALMAERQGQSTIFLSR